MNKNTPKNMVNYLKGVGRYSWLNEKWCPKCKASEEAPKGYCSACGFEFKSKACSCGCGMSPCECEMK